MSRLRPFLIALGLAVPATLQADTTLWKDVGDWDISFYPSQEGCMAMTVFERGTAFFIGYDFSIVNPTLDVVLMDESWSSIEEGKEYEVQVFFGDETPWTLNMNGQEFTDSRGLSFYFDAFADPTDLFVEEFQRETRMRWVYRGRDLGVYTLRGSRTAMREVVNCQSSFLEAREQADDPFKSSDPFAD